MFEEMAYGCAHSLLVKVLCEDEEGRVGPVRFFILFLPIFVWLLWPIIDIG